MSQEYADPGMERLAQEYYRNIGDYYESLTRTNQRLSQKIKDTFDLPGPADPQVREWGFAGIFMHDTDTDQLISKPDAYLNLENSVQLDEDGYIQCVVGLYGNRDNLKGSLMAEIAFKLNPATNEVTDFTDNAEGLLVDWLDIMRTTDAVYRRKIPQQDRGISNV